MLSECLKIVASGENLTEDESYQSMLEIIKGQSNKVKVGALLTALSIKGETVPEITGFVRAMREASLKVYSSQKPLVDTCGTGGNTLKTFNVSTAAALISASCGVTIAKHGNRSITSKCGGADILEALGVNINCNPREVEYCLDNVGMGFMFAPLFHPAMKNVAGVRKELGIRTIFNILGPLTSPACADIQLLGVFDPDYVEPMAQVLKNLKIKRAMVVHGYDSSDNPALDEISIVGKTKIALLEQNKVEVFELYPEDFGIRNTIEKHIIAPDTINENLDIFLDVLNGRLTTFKEESRLNLCLVNAAAILFIAGKVSSLEDGMNVALESVQRGYALHKLNEFIRVSNEKIIA
jgi:anthranilate phosphoribosyltransferase